VKRAGKYATAAARWSGLGPYYAMFPTAFADRVVARYTSVGDTVLDPFAGRGTVVFSAAAQERVGIGIELNPVGWVYAQTKLRPASATAVNARLFELSRKAPHYREAARRLPPFFSWCYSSEVLLFLLAARALDWRAKVVDRTVMALLLVYLHGKRGGALSNQMRQAKSMSPDYAVRWWKKREMSPPELDPVEFMLKRVAWRYAKGHIDRSASQAYLGDSTRTLPALCEPMRRGKVAKARLLFTSPPYFNVTNYHYDQWLRLWLLGGPSNARRAGGKYRAKFESQTAYADLLGKVFRRSAPLLHKRATVYVRTDRRQFTYETTKKVLCEIFPQRTLKEIPRPFERPTQTHLFGDKTSKAGEVDFVLTV
jgi:hypothetical protein